MQQQPLITTILELISSGVIIIDASDIIVTCNFAATRILRLQPPNVVGQRYQDVFASLPQPIQQDVIQMLQLSQHERSVIVKAADYTLPASGQVHWNIYASSVHDAQDTYIGITIIIEDHTQLRRLEMEIKRMKRGL